MKKIYFITGTDTGVGKTLFTCLFLNHLRQKSQKALALKPFCSGSRADARLLHSFQKEAITLDEVNPFYFPKPIAPWVAKAKKTGQGSEKTPIGLTMKRIVELIQAQKRRCETLLIEGSGGIFVPLTENLLVVDLMAKLPCEAFVVARNSLGTINHTLLTVKALEQRGVRVAGIVLMDVEKPDLSAKTNKSTLCHFIPHIPVLSLPYLGKKASRTGAIKNSAKKMQISLELVLGRDSLITS